MAIKLIYHSIIFIFALIAISRMVTYNGKESYSNVSRVYSVYCAFYAAWCIFTISAAFTKNSFGQHIFYYLSEFGKIVCYVCIFEILSRLTHYYENVSKRIVHMFTALYLYLGILLLFLDLYLGKGTLRSNIFGLYFISTNRFNEFIRSFYYILVLFGFVFLVTYYNERCKKQREIYACKLLITLVAISFGALIAEICGLVVSTTFIPSALICYAINMSFIEYLISYQRSLEFNSDDYNEYLYPNVKQSIVICDDKGNIVFENKRLSIMAENYRDNFSGRNLYEIFQISDIEKIKIVQNKGTEPVLVPAVYIKMDIPVYLSFVNTYDRYGFVFSMIVTVLNKDSVSDDDKEKLRVEEHSTSHVERIDIAPENLREMQIDDLIEMISLCNKLYDENKQDLFIFNLRGVKKMAKILRFSAIDELASRMENACLFGDWQIIDNLLIEMDRQVETLKALK